MRTAFLLIAGIHVVGLVTLLTMQGCKREQPPTEATPETQPVFEEPTNAAPEADTNAYIPPMLDTNTVAAVPAPAPMPAPTPAPATTTEYTIVKGDNFSTIGKKFGVSAKAIQEANPNVEPTKLKIGQKIMIPAPGTAASGTAVTTVTSQNGTSEDTYTVKSGDTLTSIAKKHGTTVNALRTENNLTTDRIKVGQKLKIPTKASVPQTAPAPEAPTAVTPLPQ